MGTPNFLMPSRMPRMMLSWLPSVPRDMTSTIPSGLPPMAAMSFTLTSTAKYPARYGSVRISDSIIPSAANSTYLSPMSRTAASSPSAA